MLTTGSVATTAEVPLDVLVVYSMSTSKKTFSHIVGK